MFIALYLLSTAALFAACFSLPFILCRRSKDTAPDRGTRRPVPRARLTRIIRPVGASRRVDTARRRTSN